MSCARGGDGDLSSIRNSAITSSLSRASPSASPSSPAAPPPPPAGDARPEARPAASLRCCGCEEGGGGGSWARSCSTSRRADSSRKARSAALAWACAPAAAGFLTRTAGLGSWQGRRAGPARRRARSGPLTSPLRRRSGVESAEHRPARRSPRAERRARGPGQVPSEVRVGTPTRRARWDGQ